MSITLLTITTTAFTTLPAIGEPQGSQDDALFANVAKEFTQHRADTLVTGRTAAHGVTSLAGGAVQASTEVQQAESAASTALTARRQRLAAAGERYSDARTEVTSTDVTRTAKSVKVVAEDVTTLDYQKVKGDEPADTAFRTRREFEFTQVNGKWQLAKQQLADEDGPLPVTEPSPEKPTATPLTDDGAAATERPAATQEDKTGDVTAAAYNYRAMADYALRHALDYNRNYRTFNDTGGDCTNFISQSLRAGGWQDKPGWYRDYHYWWYNRLNQTRSWINVNYWASFALSSGRTHNLSNVWYMGLGDIMQVDFDSNRRKDHSTIVTQKTSSMVYISYHTRDTRNRSLQSFLDDTRGSTFYAFRT